MFKLTVAVSEAEESLIKGPVPVSVSEYEIELIVAISEEFWTCY